MIITSENYHSKEANQEYMSVSSFKDFNGTYGRPACEACGLAKLKGEWVEEPSTALMVGSFVDSFWDRSLEKFKKENPQIYTKGSKNVEPTLRSDYKQAELIIERTLKDKKFCQYMSGEKQKIMTGELFGCMWKIKIDSYHENQCIVDLKVMQSIYDSKWVRDIGHIDFIRYWNYDIQGAVYVEIEYINQLLKCKTQEEMDRCKRLPFFLAVATKSDHPQIRLIQIPQDWLDDALSIVEANLPRILKIKSGEILPDRCEQCDYCNDTYEIDKPISAMDLLEGY